MTESPDAEVLDVNDKDKGEHALADEVLKRCVQIVANVNKYKQPRLDRIQLYRDLYAGKVKKKFRQPFNVVLPVFAGGMDTLQAEFNDDLAVQLIETEPADYIAVKKLDTLLQMELTSVAPNAKFPLKTRQDRANALISGRGFMANYAISDPEYRNCFEVFELEDAIFQPSGGGHLENHLYAGRQDIVRSEAQLRSKFYNQAKVKELLAFAKSTDHDPSFEGDEGRKALAKFKAMGLAPENESYIGEPLFKLVEMAVVVRGTRYHIVFSPWYETWVRFDKLSSIFSADLYPWVSWATHEDNKNFLSKSYADDMYGVADAVHTLFNQELTNREKRNFHARGYDIDMFPDVAKLDQAQTRPDALVPVKVPAGKRIEDGIFTFETAELRGTIDLTQWMMDTMGTNVGVSDVSKGASQNVSKKATVVFAEQQNIGKRLLLRSSPYTEAMGEIGKLFVQGCKDHLPAKKALKRLGIEGQGWDSVIRRTDLDLYGDVDVKVVSSSLEMRNSQLKKEARMKVLDGISIDPVQAAQVNPRWLVEEKLRSVGEFDDAEIKIGMDTKNYGDKEEVSRAHAAIQAVQHGEQPETYYGATTLFMQIIHDFAVNNRVTLGDAKYNVLLDFEIAHAPIAEENMLRKAREQAATIVPGTAPAETPPTGTALPNPATEVSKVAAKLP